MSLKAEPLALGNVERERPNRYRADLIVYGVKVGRVERGWSMGGRGASRYVAWADGVTVAEDRTLTGLREELREWIAEERQMEHQAIWLRIARAS